MRVDVYKNLNRHCWSIREHGGKVIAHVESCAIANARFTVRAAAQARVAAGAHRSVHAWITGDLLELGRDAESIAGAGAIAITYRPADRPAFYRRDTGAPVWRAEQVIFTRDRGAMAIAPA